VSVDGTPRRQPGSKTVTANPAAVRKNSRRLHPCEPPFLFWSWVMAFRSSPQLGHIIAAKAVGVNVDVSTRIWTDCAQHSSGQKTPIDRIGLGRDVLLRVMRQNSGPTFLSKLKTQLWLLHELG
jgi:hypothetical protein